MKDVTDWAHVCRTFRVLPPGAPYWINPRGDVYQAPRRKQDFSVGVAQAQTKIRSVLDAVIAGRNPTPFRLSGKEIRAASPSMYWFRVQGFGPHRKGKAKKVHLVGEDHALIVPTLDGLVAAASAFMHNNPTRFKKCPECDVYFVRWDVEDRGGRRMLSPKGPTCGKEECIEDRRLKLFAKREFLDTQN
ncbi:MAG: hypothetical protein ACLQKH_09430 [Steroidobacteraceae bacterium]